MEMPKQLSCWMNLRLLRVVIEAEIEEDSGRVEAASDLSG